MTSLGIVVEGKDLVEESVLNRCFHFGQHDGLFFSRHPSFFTSFSHRICRISRLNFRYVPRDTYSFLLMNTCLSSTFLLPSFCRRLSCEWLLNDFWSGISRRPPDKNTVAARPTLEERGWKGWRKAGNGRYLKWASN